MPSILDFRKLDPGAYRRMAFEDAHIDSELANILYGSHSPTPTLRDDLGDMGFTINDVPTVDQLQNRYRALAKHYHPDRNIGDAEAADKFTRVNSANARLRTTIGRIDADFGKAEERLQRYFEERSVSGGWVDAISSSGHHISSFPVDHLSEGDNRALREALEAQGYKIQDRFSRSLKGHVITVFSDAGAPITGEHIHQTLEKHFEGPLKAAQQAVKVELAGEQVGNPVSRDVTLASRAPQSSLEPLTLEEAAAGLGKDAVIAEKAVVHEAEKTAAQNIGKAEGSIVSTAEHGGGRLAKYAILAAAAVAVTSLAISIFRGRAGAKETALDTRGQPRVPSTSSMTTFNECPYDFTAYGVDKPKDSWVSRVQDRHSATLER